VPPTAAKSEEAIPLRTPVFDITFSNRGGVARSWVLRQYTDNNNHPLDVIGPKFSAAHGYPLEFWTPDADLTQQLDQALYQVKETHPKPGATTIAFDWSNGTIAAHKQLTFDDGYVVDVRATVTQNGAPVDHAAIAWPGNFGDRSVANHNSAQQLFEDQGTALNVVSQKKVGNGQTSTGSYNFAGLEDLYFAVAYLPTTPGSQTITTFQTQFQPAPNAKPVETIGLAFSAGAENTFHLFVGPKKIDLLRAINPRLRGLVDFGWFSFLADPIFVWMNWTYVHWIHNYGWVILFITFVIMMAMFPFRWKAQKTQIKMSAIQPKIKAINDKMKKYKMNDPRRQELQKEQMKLFQEHGVNPLGGCLPMLLPIILIWAFYKVLEYAIELRHAPWLGYINDLSAKDPYYILPIILVISQFWTMSLMPMTPGADPKQMRMMKWTMPAVLGYIFFFLPSGVNLYYLASNAVSVGQQVWINKHFGLTAGGNKIKGAARAKAGDAKPPKPGKAYQGTK
ncbi:MAG: membrane protein insertase YidC, partial [Terriglobales bacterium]